MTTNNSIECSLSQALAGAETSEMTVEQFLMEYGKQLQERIQKKSDLAQEELKQHWEKTKILLLAPKAQSNTPTTTSNSGGGNDENAMMNSVDTISESINTTIKTADTISSLALIHIEAVEGMYKGDTWAFPNKKGKNTYKIGRSKSKEFISYGISVSKDSEASTTHGRFEFKKDGKGIFYTDLGSTNGSVLDNKLLPAKIPFRLDHMLRDGGTVELVVGSSRLKLTLL